MTALGIQASAAQKSPYPRRVNGYSQLVSAYSHAGCVSAHIDGLDVSEQLLGLVRSSEFSH